MDIHFSKDAKHNSCLGKLNFCKLNQSRWFKFKSLVLASAIVCVAYYGVVNQEEVSKVEPSDVQEYGVVSDSFIELLAKTEGVSNKFYPDNKGFAVGYGFNPTQHTEGYNAAVLSYAGVDLVTQEKILSSARGDKTAKGRVPEGLTTISLTDKQIEKMAMYAKMVYERDFVSVLGKKIRAKGISGEGEASLMLKYMALPSEQKDVLTHMAYKVGHSGLSRYGKFFDRFIVYLDSQTLKNKSLVAMEFNYRYKQGKKWLNDDRISKLHANMFLGGYDLVVGQKKSLDLKTVENLGVGKTNKLG